MNELIEIEDRDLRLLLIVNMRYSIERDNHLAPFNCIYLLKKYLPFFKKEERENIIEQFKEEVDFYLKMKNYENEKLWLNILEELKRFHC